MKEKNCKNCKYWFPREEKFACMGDCRKISQDEIPAALGCVGKIEDEEVTMILHDGILTGKDFGCIHFEYEILQKN